MDSQIADSVSSQSVISNQENQLSFNGSKLLSLERSDTDCDNFSGATDFLSSNKNQHIHKEKVELCKVDKSNQNELPKPPSSCFLDELNLVSHGLVDSLSESKDDEICSSTVDNVEDIELLDDDVTIGNELIKDDLNKVESTELVEATSSSKLHYKNNISCDQKNCMNETVHQSNWRMLTGVDGSYYWNVDTGATQFEAPFQLKESHSNDDDLDSPDSSLADLEGAAFRYASLHINDDSLTDHHGSSDWTMDSDVGTMFSVRSLGWLPLEHFSSDAETSSSEVNACIKHLSSSHGQFMDGVGAWGEGKDLVLLIENDYLKLLDPTSKTVLHTQAIKHIRIWGVGGSSPHDFAYVAKDNVTRQYKCHVFRCDAAAKAIAQELHSVCEKISMKLKNDVFDLNKEKIKKEKIALSTIMPIPKAEAISEFSVKYLGVKKVESVNGIQTIKNVIRDITISDAVLCENCTATITASAFVISRKSDDITIVNCRMRCLSFMGIGDDISLFAFIHVVGNEANCHVLQCQPNAAKIALAVQEACMLRFQKAIDSKQVANENKDELPRRKSFKQYFKSVFAKKNTTQ